MYSLSMIFCLYIRWCVCLLCKVHKVNGWVKLRYWQQVWQLHVKGVAMVTGHSQLSHPLPPSLCVSLSLSLYRFRSLFFFFLLPVIPSHTSGRLYMTAVALWTKPTKASELNILWPSLTYGNTRSPRPIPGERTCLWESVAGSGIVPSCLDGFFFPSEHHNWGKKKKRKTKVSPEQIITSWQEKLSCSAAEQGSCVSQTQMSHCFLLPCLTRWGHQVPLC